MYIRHTHAQLTHQQRQKGYDFVKKRKLQAPTIKCH